MNLSPHDVIEILRLLRKADDVTAVLLLQAWGEKQRLIGGRDELTRRMEEISHAQA